MSNENVAILRRLHQGTELLLLPNAWDAASASLFQHAGAKAIATTSAGFAWALGYQDGRSLPVAEVVAAAARIVRVIDIPLSLDIENGYSDDPAVVAELVKQLAAIGVAGINIEDGPDDPMLLAAKIEAIRAALNKTGGDMFINARTDVFLAELVPPPKRSAETIKRGKQYAEAGADGLFVPALHDSAEIRSIVSDVPLPINVMAWPGVPSVDALAGLGARRFSAGSAISQSVWASAEQAAKAFLATGDTQSSGAISARTFGEMQQLFPAN